MSDTFSSTSSSTYPTPATPPTPSSSHDEYQRQVVESAQRDWWGAANQKHQESLKQSSGMPGANQ